MKVVADLEFVSRPALQSPRAGVFNTSDNLGKLHQLENRPKSNNVWLIWVGFLTMLTCMSTQMEGNQLESSVTRDVHGRERFRTMMALSSSMAFKRATRS